VLGGLSALLCAAAIVPYVSDTVRGATRPNSVTWFLWTLNGLILGYAQFSAGASWTLVVLVVSTASDALVAFLSLRYGQRHYGWVDGACFAMALIAVLAWWITANPLTAIVVGVLAEVFAVFPTILKTWRKPESETTSTYWLAAASVVASVAASTKFDLANLLYPAYSIATSTTIALLTYRHVRRSRRARLSSAKA
jgi:hypothetical protein